MAREILNLGRVEFGKIVQVITGHNWFARHRARLGEVQTEGICRLCGTDDEETAHLFWKCPTLAQEQALFSDKSKEGFPWTVDSILWFLQTPQIQRLVESEQEGEA